MIRKELVNGLKGVADDSRHFTCDACVCGKMVQGPFQDGHRHTDEHLGRLHSDVCGPMDVISLGGNRYFCLLIDDHSGFIWYQPVAMKLDFSTWFIKMDKLFLNQFGTHMKILCSDRGGEYVNTTLESFCADNGIILERSIAHTPEQNGVAEQANQKIEDKLHTLIKDTAVPDFLWADAGAMATYSINRTISALSGGITLFKAFHGTRPSVAHMHVWYCNVFIHCDKSLGARKLGERGKLVKFLGYPENVSRYRTYDPTNKKVEIVQAPMF